MNELLETARRILATDTELIEPGKLARLDQAAAQLRDSDVDPAEPLGEALDALDYASDEHALTLADVAYVSALALVGGDE